MVEGSEPAQSKEQKQKLTLTVNRDVIEKAKAEGINISAITEQLLRAVTYQSNDGNTIDDVHKAYSAVFSEVQIILKQYTTSIIVGHGYESDEEGELEAEYDVILSPGRLLKLYDNGEGKTVSVSEILGILYEPNKIINNLIQEITQAAKRNKQKINELTFALRFFKLFNEEIIKLSSDKADKET
jgi:hypothetical protein